MSSNYRNFFGFEKEPFAQNIKIDDIFQRPGLNGVVQRTMYAIDNRMITVITGDIGAGKSTSLRFAVSKLHPSKYVVLPVIATTGSVLELLKQLCMELNFKISCSSIATLMKTVRSCLKEISNKKQIPVIIIDEAHLLRFEVFAQLHTLLQSELDKCSLASLILCGQNSLIERLKYHHSVPLASRIMGISHLEGLNLDDMRKYIIHHLNIVGCDIQLFNESAIIAIHQGSGGILRKANLLAKGALIASTIDQQKVIVAEHVRIASTEII
jgi:type II secretory pathway predicted ATPase ExeA